MVIHVFSLSPVPSGEKRRAHSLVPALLFRLIDADGAARPGDNLHYRLHAGISSLGFHA